MNPVEVHKRLLEAAFLLQEVLKDGGWREFLEQAEIADAREQVQSLLSPLDEDVLRSALDDLTERQERLLAGRAPSSLPTPELKKYAALGGLKQVLLARRISAQLEPDFLSWLVDVALPALQRAAPFVIAVL